MVRRDQATFVLNEHGQQRIESETATVLSRTGGVPVEGTLSMGHVVASTGRIGDLQLDGVELASCANSGFDCSFATHVETEPVLIHARKENGVLVEGLVASRGAGGAAMYHARRLASAPGDQRQVDLSEFERLQPLDDGAAGPTRVRITIESE